MMRPRNVLTQTNNMRKLMGLPLLNEDTGETAEDVKKKVLTEDRAFSLGFSNQGGLTFTEETINENTKTEYLAVKRPDGKYEIHMKTGGGEYKEFKLPPDGSIWTNDGKGYNSESEAQSKIGEIKNRIKPEEDRYGEKTGDGYYIDETTLSQEFNDDNEGDTDQIEEQDDFGDGAEGDGESPLEQVTEGSFSQYNITLDD